MNQEDILLDLYDQLQRSDLIPGEYEEFINQEIAKSILKRKEVSETGKKP